MQSCLAEYNMICRKCTGFHGTWHFFKDADTSTSSSFECLRAYNRSGVNSKHPTASSKLVLLKFTGTQILSCMSIA